MTRIVIRPEAEPTHVSDNRKILYVDQVDDTLKMIDADLTPIDLEAGSGGGGGEVQKHTVTLTPTDILALGDTPFEIIPSPGPDLAAIPTLVLAYAERGAAAYVFADANDDHIDISPSSDSGFAYQAVPYLPASRLQSALDPEDDPRPQLVALWVQLDASLNMYPVDEGWVMQLDNQVNPTGGDGTLEVTSYFVVVSVS